MISCKNLLICFTAFFVLLSFAFAQSTYNQLGQYTISVSFLKDNVYNDEIYSEFNVNIKNNLNFPQEIKINIPNQTGWDIELSENLIYLNKNESKILKVKFIANSEFDYSTNVVTPNEIFISEETEYVGYFEFPISFVGLNDTVSLKYQIFIDKRPEKIIQFNTKVSTSKLSPVSPLKFTVTGEDLVKDEEVLIIAKIGDYELELINDVFNEKNSYKIYQMVIPSQLDPGLYDAKLTIRLLNKDGKSAKEWFEDFQVNVVEYNNLIEKKSSEKNFFREKFTIEITNEGNLKSVYESKISLGFFKKLFFMSPFPYEKINSDKVLNLELEKGETKIIHYSINYSILYIILIFITIVLIYIIYRKSSNPLDVETSVYEIVRVKHEGVKSLKLKIGFENIKADEIEKVRLVFRMPSYLNVKENSFLLTEPNHVLKGKTQFKLIWEFQRFEKDDSRIIGFTLVNSKGVLGDIVIPDLELEVKLKGKIRKYYTSFPMIRG